MLFHSYIVDLILFSSYLLKCNSELNFVNDVENNKSFTSLPTTIKTFVNDTVLLPCYHTRPFRYVRWHRDDVPLADSRHPNMISSERVHLWSNGSLEVSNVQPEDSGDYYCEMMANDSHVVQTHAIEVQSPPIVLTEPTGTLELPIGSMFEVVCEANGVPQPAITWRHNDRTIEQYHIGNRQTHLVHIKSRDMSGPIECMATNGVGEPVTAGIYLNVLFEPEMYVPKTVVYANINARVHLECIVEAAPQASVQWLLHGVPVNFDSRVSVHDTELQENRSLTHYFTKTKHILLINKVRNYDFGVYECRAENDIGANSVHIDLTGRPSPCVFKLNPSVQSSVSHALVWQTESFSSILEYKLKFRQVPSRNMSHDVKLDWTELTIPSEISPGSIHTKSYTLRGLQPASIFEVMVLARNHFGWNENSKIVRFATGGEVELPNYSTESDLYYDDEDQDDKDKFMEELSKTFVKTQVQYASVGRSGSSSLGFMCIYSLLSLLYFPILSVIIIF